MFFLLLFMLLGVRTQDATPQSYLQEHRLPFKAVQFLQHEEHLRKGPILFPNDAPPPPPTPLIVTSRPLSESIARSDLNPNNSIAAQSQYHQVTFRPNYLARKKNYEPYSYTLATVAPVYDFDPAKINEERKETFFKDYERLLAYMHPRKQHRKKRSDDPKTQPSERSILNQRRLMEFITPRKPDPKAGDVLVQTLQQRSFDQNKKIPMADEEKGKRPQNNKVLQHAPSYSTKPQSTTKDYYDENEFNEEDNNFDFDFKKLYLHVVKPLHEFDSPPRQQHTHTAHIAHTASKADPYQYKNSPDHYYHSKNKGGEHDYSQETNPSDNYAFSYTVKDHKTGDDFSHSQKSTGSATNGEYRVLLPDGRTQIVSYTADENGYKADVRYDEHHNQENSIDFDYDKDKSLGNNNHLIAKQNYGHNQDNIGHEHILYRPQQNLVPYKANVPNYEQTDVENINDYGDKNDNNFQYFNVYPTKAAFVGTTANINDRTLDGLSDNNNDYLEQYNARFENNDEVERAKDDYKISGELDFSKEAVDYSSELDHANEPYKSKFSSLFNNQNAQAQAQVRPSYNELKPLFVTNANDRRNAAIPVSTVRPVYAVTPADVVAITPKKPVHNLYTNIKNIVTPAPFIFSTPSPSTPRSYLLSTIANLKHQISLAEKPVLSEQYIDKINKYLSYSNPVKIN